MSARGVHFAVTPAQEKHLLAAKSARKLMEQVEEIEESWEKPFVVETDKAWNAIHRCLTDGSLLYVSGVYSLNHCICGGRQLYRGRSVCLTRGCNAIMQRCDETAAGKVFAKTALTQSWQMWFTRAVVMRTLYRAPGKSRRR
jgi:hypothetical protein